MGNDIPTVEIGGVIAEKYEIYTGVSEKFAKKRDALGWSLEKAAAKSGVPVSTLSRIEHGGSKKLDVINAAALCQAYGCSMDELFDIELPEQPDKEPTHTAFLEAENAELKETLCKERKLRTILVIAFIVLTLMIFAWFILIDGPNGDFGLIRYLTALGDSSIPAWAFTLGAAA